MMMMMSDDAYDDDDRDFEQTIVWLFVNNDAEVEVVVDEGYESRDEHMYIRIFLLVKPVNY